MHARHNGDDLYKNNDDRRFVEANERAVYAKKLRDYLEKDGS